MLASGSKTEVTLACVPSAVLPRVEEEIAGGERGRAIHDLLERIGAGEPAEESIAKAPASFRAFAEAIPLGDLPIDPAGYAVEVAFVLDAVTGEAREIGRRIGRNYGELLASEVPATADLVALVGEDAVYVGDWKTGRSLVTPAAENGQLRTLALAACRTYERSRAIVELVHLREDGTVYRDRAELDVFDLEQHAERWREAAATAAKVRAQVARGEVPDVRVGPWCGWCPAKIACPATGDLVRRFAVMADGEGDLAQRVEALLSPENAADALVRWKAVAKVLDVVEDAIKRIAKDAPIPLPDGRVWGPTHYSRETVKGGTVFHVLEQDPDVGKEGAYRAVSFESSKEAIEDEARLVVAKKKARGEKTTIKAEKERILAKVRGLGGVSVTEVESFTFHKRKAGELPAAPAGEEVANG